LPHPNGIHRKRIRTCPAPGTATFLSTKEKTPGEEISTALYVLAILILQLHIPPNRNHSILSVSHSYFEVPSCERNMRQRESAVLHRPIESAYLIFSED
jgi:hypothetical protein